MDRGGDAAFCYKHKNGNGHHQSFAKGIALVTPHAHKNTYRTHTPSSTGSFKICFFSDMISHTHTHVKPFGTEKKYIEWEAFCRGGGCNAQQLCEDEGNWEAHSSQEVNELIMCTMVLLGLGMTVMANTATLSGRTVTFQLRRMELFHP